MKKVMLNMDALEVETFTAGESALDQGTVNAHAEALEAATTPYTCSHEIACYYSKLPCPF